VAGSQQVRQPFWDDPNESLAWDHAVVGGELLPGLCVVKTTVKRDIQLKKAKGKGGQTSEDQGNLAATGEIRMRIWTRAQWNEWLRILPTIQPRRPEGPKDPLEIIHPEPNSKSVSQITVDEIPPYEGPDEKGILTVVMKFKEWTPAPKPVKAGSGAAKSDKRLPVYKKAIADRATKVGDFVSGFWGD